MLVRYFVAVQVVQDLDGTVAYAVANDGTLWQSTDIRSGQPPAVWTQLPDLPQ